MHWKDEIEENLKFGVIDIVILKLLSKQDMYGYQIKQMIEETCNHKIEIKMGSLYGPLYRMEKKNMISSRKELAGEKRFRMYYHIENGGKEYLDYALNRFNEIYDCFNNILNEKEGKENE